MDYTHVLAGPLPEAGTRALAGIPLVLLGYLVVSQLLVSVGSWVAWLARGRPGSFGSFSPQVVGYQLPEGVLIVDLALASAIPVAMAAMYWMHHMAPGWLVSVRPGMRWGLLAAFLVIGFVVLNGVYLAGRMGTQWQFAPPEHAWLWIVLVVLTSPLQAAGEEFLFRGYLQQAVGAVSRRTWVAVLVSALVFALMHGTQNLPLFADRLGFGLVAGYMVVLTGGLEASIAVHAANNVSTFCYAIMAGTVAQTRTVSQSSWSGAAVNVFSYALAGALAVLVTRVAKARTRTPQTPV
ncbi:CPBP family intramembrane glutamic endopeptidase [Propionibacterium cyclohexanicum]|uniref:CPBP family intramembrane glutamic endopeptidase n=1 Tax=Propionibacterium cyclohexanicum TaxID=64702 RepID=UPI000B83214C|nr:type II CAAX endopeptidase family protein [Propionibacterium cyclohexanicum]